MISSRHQHLEVCIAPHRQSGRCGISGFGPGGITGPVVFVTGVPFTRPVIPRFTYPGVFQTRQAGHHPGVSRDTSRAGREESLTEWVS